VTGITIRNATDYDTKEVRRLARRTLRVFEVTGVEVTVNYTRKRDGHVRGWYRNYWYPKRGEKGPQIRASLPRPEETIQPYTPYRRKGEMGKKFDMTDWREALVAIVAHEATHHKQGCRRNGKGGFRELDCDLAAYRAVIYYREGTIA